MKRILLALVMLVVFATAASADATYTITERVNWGNKRVTFGYVQFSGEAYVTGGIAVTARNLGLDNVDRLIIGDMTNPSYGWKFDYENMKMIIYMAETNEYEPAASPATSDYFVVNDDNSAASNCKLLVVFGTSSNHMMLGYMDATGVTNGATSHYPLIAAADSSSVIAAVDSSNGFFFEREELIYADTLFFDDDATNPYDALMYSGIGLGDMGNLYIPFDNGNYIKVLKKTNSQITQAGASALYFDENAGLDDKILSVCDGNEDSTFEVDPTYTSLPLYNPYTSEQVASGTSITAQVYFMAIGN